MILSIDGSKCTGCGICKEVCPSYVISLEENPEKSKKIAIEKYPKYCLECGHCQAACPQGAIIHTKMDSKEFLLKEDPNITYEQFHNLGRNRRAIRRFSKKEIPDEIIEKIINSAKYCPTGENAQALKYLVIKNPDQLQKVQKATLKFFRLIGKKRAKRVKEIEGDDKKPDPIVPNSPALIIIYTKKFSLGKSLDAGIASYHIALIAEIFGLGTCINGMHTYFSRFVRSIRKASMIPRGHKAVASICIGYPKYKYYRTVSRKETEYEII